MIIKKVSLLSVALLISCIFVTGSIAATLTDSTSVTIVNVVQYPSSYPVEHWPGAWPSSPDAKVTADGQPAPEGMEVYMTNVTYTVHSMHWVTIPYARPYPVFPNTISNMIVAVYSGDQGKSFYLQSWDYLQQSTSSKGTERGMPDCWMGAMVHSLCDRKPGECNGRYRSNLYFSTWPTGASGCWGTPDPQ